MPLNQVELVRSKIAMELLRGLQRFRIFLSCTDGNNSAVELLRTGEHELAGLFVELTLERIGHQTEVTSDSRAARSQARRAIAKRR